MPEFQGLCGRNNPRPCKLSWSDTSHPRIGVYPSSLLPAKRTLYYCTTSGGYYFNKPPIDPGQSFGLPIFGILNQGQFSVQADVFTPSTRIVISFCRTANRINVAHTLTQNEINSIDPDTGIGEINVGEYVYDAIAVTDEIDAVEGTLSEQDLNDIKNGTESKSDRAFRKLFDNNIPVGRNRLFGVKVNKIGIEYRLDNGDSKSISVLDASGQGFFVGQNASQNYRDGSSKILLVDLYKITDRLPRKIGEIQPPIGTLQEKSRIPKVGDVIYLSYVAVREHYIRQSISARWTVAAQSIPPQCFGSITNLKLANFRFYEWEVDNNNKTTQSISGWRVVETQDYPVNFSAIIVDNNDSRILADFAAAGGRNIRTLQYQPAKATTDQILSFINNRALMPTYNFNLDEVSGGANYHINSGINSNKSAYSKSEWFTRNNYSSYRTWEDARGHVFFNIHKKALKKRDIDKFGIERFLADEISKDISKGKLTFFPFMDDENTDNPSNTFQKALDNTNTKFSPILPVSRWSIGNGEVECGVGGGVILRIPGTNGDVLAVFSINSNLITERFETDTRILVEKFAHEGHGGDIQTIAIEGLGDSTGAITCLSDLSQNTGFVGHVNNDFFLTFNKFAHESILNGMRILDYRPDIDNPPLTNESLLSEQYEKLLGYNLILGDSPGYKPGNTVNVSNSLDIKYFSYKATQFTGENTDATTIINIIKSTNKLSLPVSTGYYGKITISYSAEKNINIIILFKSGGTIVGSIDSVVLIASKNNSINIPHQWYKCDTIEIVGQSIEFFNKFNFVVTQLSDDIANDFLNEKQSSSLEEKNLPNNNKFLERSIFFQTNTMSCGVDKNDRLFMFFEDQDGGISCAQSNNYGDSWIYHYGIVELINKTYCRSPFIVNMTEINTALLFYSFNGKILCKEIKYHLFLDEDSLFIERYSDRISNNGTITTEKASKYSNSGQSLRRWTNSSVVLGDLTDIDFLSLFGRNFNDVNNSDNEIMLVEQIDDSGSSSLIKKNVKTNPIVLSHGTACINQDTNSSYFSAYRNNRGEVKLFLLGDTDPSAGGGVQLQCYNSTDNGQTWYYFWEYLENKFDRLSIDIEKNTQFIDISNSNSNTDPFISNQLYPYGINLHWSRLKKHKIQQGNITLNSESQVLKIDAPYVFCNDAKIFIFYIYQNCLLCKIFNDDVFNYVIDKKTRSSSQTTMQILKEIIEKNLRAYFIDGDLSSNEIREEIHHYINSETNERQVEGNIIFNSQFGIDSFNSFSTIPSQRVCAYSLPNGNVRVFYKLSGSTDLHAAIWNGNEWHVEEFYKMNNKQPQIIINNLNSNIKNITGGFGNTGF